MMSREWLLEKAREGKYKPEILEKVYGLLDVLSKIEKLPYLKNRLVLKGGTALNLFYFDQVPRLSVDIDLNYIGSLSRETMLLERPVINETISQILASSGMESYRNPRHHAGGKMVWRYDSVLGQKGNLEIDLNYMYRKPLLPVQFKPPAINNLVDFTFPVLDIHELAAGKLSALFTRTASRDLFDSHYMLTQMSLNQEKLRQVFVIYIAMTSLMPVDMSIDMVRYDVKELTNRLLPVLRQEGLPRIKPKLEKWATVLLKELQQALSLLLPLRPHEYEFIQKIRDLGVVEPELITTDAELQETIIAHPAILWAVRKTTPAEAVL